MKMKKTAAALLAAVLAASAPLAGAVNNALSVTASAEEAEAERLTEGDWVYKLNDDGETVRLLDYNGTDTELVIPATLGGKSVTKMHLFDDHPSLKSLAIPDSVTEIYTGTWGGENSLEAVTVGENNPNYSSVDGVLFNRDKSVLIWYPRGRKDKTYTIPDSVTKLDWLSFYKCKYLTSVTIPDSVTTLDEYVFMCCAALTSITIPDSITEINISDFSNCTSLTDITIPDSVTFINSSAFRGCTALTSITIPESVTKFGHFTFCDCTALTSFTIPSGMTVIDFGSLEECTALKSVRIPNSVTAIRMGAFDGCSSLETIYFSGTQEEWEAIEIADYNDGLENVEVIYNAPAESEPTESTVTPGGTDPVSEPDSSTGEQTVLKATLKNVDSKNGLSGEQLDKLLFGDSGWTWGQVEKIVFTSDALFSVQYTAADGSTKTLGEMPAERAEDDGIWNTEWTLDTSLMSKDKSFVKLIAKDGTAEIKSTIYIKKDAANPGDSDKTSGSVSNTESNSDNANTGIAMAIAPVVLAASAAIVVFKKKK